MKNTHIEQDVTVEAHNEQKTLEEVQTKQIVPEDAHVSENCENLISYVHKGNRWDRNNIVVNNIFAFQVALDIRQNDEDPKPQNVEEFRKRNDWPKWKEVMQSNYIH